MNTATNYTPPPEQPMEAWLKEQHERSKALFQKYAAAGDIAHREKYRGETEAFFTALQHLRIQKEVYDRY